MPVYVPVYMPAQPPTAVRAMPYVKPATEMKPKPLKARKGKVQTKP
jgi:hypothetical protein